MKHTRFLIAAAVATVAAAGPLGPVDPAGAAPTVTATTSGTTATVTVTGSASAFDRTRIDFTCVSGKLAVNGSIAAPGANCATLTQVTVNGDDGEQAVDGTPLTQPPFTTGARLVATLNGGRDSVVETRKADQLSLGAGDDYLSLYAGGASNTSIDLGAGGDQIAYDGTAAADRTILSATGASTTIATTTGSTSSTSTVLGAEGIRVSGLAGDDVLDGRPVAAGAGLTGIALVGGDGNDQLFAPSVGATLEGDAGTNTLTGGAGPDRFDTGSQRDTISAGGTAAVDTVADYSTYRSGGQAFSGFGPEDGLESLANGGDVVMRVRPGSGGGSLLSTSLDRTGQQRIAASNLRVTSNTIPDRGLSLFDVTPLAGELKVYGAMFFGSGPDDVDLVPGQSLIDVTIPTGTWTTTEHSEFSRTIDPSDPAYGSIYAGSIGADSVSVHGPWTDKDQGFAHRATRDLFFRFPTDAARDNLRLQLQLGRTTRAQAVASMVNSDEYRGLDVDRVFIDFLDRKADPQGRAYWINSIRNGKPLRTFRAQLFGSPEYYRNSGSTNAKFVQAAYKDVLGRYPDPSGAAYWTSKIDRGTPRSTVANQFLASAEAARGVVSEQFLRFLDRVPTTAESNTWTPKMGTATGEQDLVAFLAASNAYYGRS